MPYHDLIMSWCENSAPNVRFRGVSWNWDNAQWAILQPFISLLSSACLRHVFCVCLWCSAMRSKVKCEYVARLEFGVWHERHVLNIILGQSKFGGKNCAYRSRVSRIENKMMCSEIRFLFIGIFWRIFKRSFCLLLLLLLLFNHNLYSKQTRRMCVC